MIQNIKTIALIFMATITSSCNAMDLESGMSNNEKSVSFIYYPCHRFAPVGHAELELNGSSWDPVNGFVRTSLESMIETTTKRGGMPFFRFVLQASQDQINTAQNIVSSRSWPEGENCSRNVINPLIKAGICSMPLPIKVSPLLTASYLATAKKMGMGPVKKIDYYGSSSIKRDICKTLPGVAGETVKVALVTCFIGCSIRIIYDEIANSNSTDQEEESPLL